MLTKKWRMKSTLTQKIRSYIAERKDTKIKPLHKKRDKALKKTSSPKSQAEILNKYLQEEEQLRIAFEPKN